MTGAEAAILRLIIGSVLEWAPELIALMKADTNLRPEDVIPTPRAVLAERARQQEEQKG